MVFTEIRDSYDKSNKDDKDKIKRGFLGKIYFGTKIKNFFHSLKPLLLLYLKAGGQVQLFFRTSSKNSFS